MSAGAGADWVLADACTEDWVGAYNAERRRESARAVSPPTRTFTMINSMPFFQI
jgi:hypothetical protein